MTPRQPQTALERAAALWGIEPQYWDIFGRLHVTTPDTQRAILEALGVPAGGEAALTAALAQAERAAWTRLLPPSVVLSESAPPVLPVHLPEGLANAVSELEIVPESGDPHRIRLSLGAHPVVAAITLDGERFLRKDVPLDPLPIGYYDVTLRISGEEPASTRLIVAPERAHLPEGLRAAGVAVHLAGVRSARNWGCGDFRDLRETVDWAADETGVSFIGLNPLHAIPNRKPYNTSPYLPTSILFRNALYLDIEAIEDFAASPAAWRLWREPATQRALAELRASKFVEYEAVWAWKRRFLKLAFLQFLREYRRGTPRSREFDAFQHLHGDRLDRFAVWCALDEYLHARQPEVWIWPDWPEAYHDPDSPETHAFAKKHWRLVLFYKYAQWQIDRQLESVQAHAVNRGLPIGLYHDLALATDRCGADLWAYRRFYVAGCRVGSPPDDFAPQGQDWAFPPPHAQRHYENGYRLFVQSIRNNCRHGGALRIDHVMRLFRLYWIPDGSNATQGTYVRDRAEDLLRILALESVRNKVILVGEDLGTVEPHVRETLARFGVLSYRLFYFERQGDAFIGHHDYPPQALVSSTTHDLPTLAGFWTGEDIEARRRAGVLGDDLAYREQQAERARDRQRMLDSLTGLGFMPKDASRIAADYPELTGDLHNAVIGFLASTPSALLLVNQEDLTKEVHQQNLPGTTGEYPNWSRKMKFTVEQLRTEKLARDFVAMFEHWLEASGRMNRR